MGLDTIAFRGAGLVTATETALAIVQGPAALDQAKVRDIPPAIIAAIIGCPDATQVAGVNSTLEYAVVDALGIPDAGIKGYFGYGGVVACGQPMTPADDISVRARQSSGGNLDETVLLQMVYGTRQAALPAYKAYPVINYTAGGAVTADVWTMSKDITSGKLLKPKGKYDILSAFGMSANLRAFRFMHPDWDTRPGGPGSMEVGSGHWTNFSSYGGVRTLQGDDQLAVEFLADGTDTPDVCFLLGER